MFLSNEALDRGKKVDFKKMKIHWTITVMGKQHF